MERKLVNIIFLPLIGVLLIVMCIKRKGEKLVDIAVKNDIISLDYDFIKKFETGNGKPVLVVFQNKIDGNYEVGYGHVLNKMSWAVGETISVEKAEEFFMNDIKKAFAIYGDSLKWDNFSDNQKRAIISHAYNTGAKSGTIISLANAGKWDDLAEWMPKHYITSGGKEYSGLVRRRQYEADLMLS